MLHIGEQGVDERRVSSQRTAAVRSAMLSRPRPRLPKPSSSLLRCKLTIRPYSHLFEFELQVAHSSQARSDALHL